MAYERILVGTDGSETAAVAMRTATGLAKRTGGEVHLVCAHGNGLDDKAATKVLSEARAAVRAEGVGTKTHMRSGEPAPVVLEVADVQGADLIVVGNVGMGKARRFKLGGIAEMIAVASPCDVLIVHTKDREGTDGEYRHLVIGTDGSATATEATRKGVDLARALGAQVTLVHVGDPLVGAVVLDEAARSAEGLPEVERRAEEGEPAERIVDVAGGSSADLIVVGNKGMAGPRRYLLGSIPSRVAHESPVDVLIAKTVGRSIDDLAPGHGGLVQVHGRRLAIFKAEDGSITALSARCQHMGCTVDWNDAERTWDCPCHGSRYRFDGAVIKGPATKDLDRAQLSEP
jgi:nucleotide-binding universal stress UspA family protein/nitrite reductase/ring-hydroxylating ferredoxin subunit